MHTSKFSPRKRLGFKSLYKHRETLELDRGLPTRPVNCQISQVIQEANCPIRSFLLYLTGNSPIFQIQVGWSGSVIPLLSLALLATHTQRRVGEGHVFLSRVAIVATHMDAI